MLKVFWEIGRAKNLPCLKADILMLALLLAVALMAGGLYAYKKCTGFSQILGVAVFVATFLLLLFLFLGWLIAKAVKEDSGEFREKGGEI